MWPGEPIKMNLFLIFRHKSFCPNPCIFHSLGVKKMNYNRKFIGSQILVHNFVNKLVKKTQQIQIPMVYLLSNKWSICFQFWRSLFLLMSCCSFLFVRGAIDFNVHRHKHVASKHKLDRRIAQWCMISTTHCACCYYKTLFKRVIWIKGFVFQVE